MAHEKRVSLGGTPRDWREEREREQRRRLAAQEVKRRQAMRERMAQLTRESEALRTEMLASSAADLQRQEQATAAEAARRRQADMAARQNLIDYMGQILRPPVPPLEPMQSAEPYQGSPHFGDANFSPDAAIARFQPWKPWQP